MILVSSADAIWSLLEERIENGNDARGYVLTFPWSEDRRGLPMLIRLTSDKFIQPIFLVEIHTLNEMGNALHR